MEQFDILYNKNKSSKNDVPYLINLQSDPMNILATTVVAPLRKTSKYSEQILTKLHIPITINNIDYTIFTSELASIPTNIIGDKVLNANYLRQDCTEAIDLLFTGF
ncbi:plasmid maintenance protein CcdB [Thiospirochaeta perfilievii]|uniref:Toxin CcdB n=1 Tax=Thiospirochaeta perfilievii TaxID=252967 RepID=A0A5C1QD50_9SPIO|nr:CcdB family protein [Thiospirochaeta perfilievii]QEN05337.1 plasmid maintenance protein CcdB [Thiospirochaeta perfilievii]